MVIISHKPLREQAIIHPEWKEPLERWYRITEQADWKNFSELKKTFNSRDVVGNGLYVFNIKGNVCRLIARILFKSRTLFVRFVGTHSEYDRLKMDEL